MTKLFLILLILSSLPEFVSASSRSEISFLSFCKETSTYGLNEIPSSVIFAEAKTHGLDTELEQDKLNLESAVYGARDSVYIVNRLRKELGFDLPYTDLERYMAGECFESLLKAYLPAKYKRLKDRDSENKRKAEAEQKRIEREQQQQEAKIRQQKQIEEMEALKAQQRQDAENREQLRMEKFEALKAQQRQDAEVREPEQIERLVDEALKAQQRQDAENREQLRMEREQQQERMERIEALKARQQAGSQVIEKREIEELERICVEDSELCDAELEYQESRVLTESVFKIMEMPLETEE